MNILINELFWWWVLKKSFDAIFINNTLLA